MPQITIKIGKGINITPDLAERLVAEVNSDLAKIIDISEARLETEVIGSPIASINSPDITVCIESNRPLGLNKNDLENKIMDRLLKIFESYIKIKRIAIWVRRFSDGIYITSKQL